MPLEQSEIDSTTKTWRAKKWINRGTIVIAVLALCGVLVSAVFSLQPNHSTGLKLPDVVEEDLIATESDSVMSEPFPTKWPQLVGMPGEQAKAIIIKENPSLTRVDILPDGSMVTMDYREDRVRIFVDEAGNVVGTPSVG